MVKKMSTSELPEGRFRAHGLVEVTLAGNIAHYEARGPFNEELAIAFNKVQEHVIPEIAALNRWGELTIFHNSMLASLDTLSHFTEALKARAAQGSAPSATAYVAGPEVEGAEIMGTVISKCYQDVGLLLRIFTSADEAETWLVSTLSSDNSAS